MKTHVSMVHEEIKPFKCYICDYSCSKRSNMKTHVSMVHEEIKPFKCDIYDYSCSLKSSMKRHVTSVHEGEKPFKCNICDATFSLNSNMKRHVSKIHERKKSWSIDTSSFWINFEYPYTICWFTFVCLFLELEMWCTRITVPLGISFLFEIVT